jgi:hypothetical protein
LLNATVDQRVMLCTGAISGSFAVTNVPPGMYLRTIGGNELWLLPGRTTISFK